MVGLNKSCITASAWLRAQDNTTKSLLTLSAPTDAFCPISRKNIDAAPKMSILQIYRYFPVLEMTFCVDGRNCPSRSRWEANKHPPPGENIVSEDSSNCSRFCHTCDLIKRFLLPTNILNRDIAVGQLNIYNNVSRVCCVVCIRLFQIRRVVRKEEFFPLITLVVIWRPESSSNLKFPRLFSANDHLLSFGLGRGTRPIPDYCQSKTKPCNERAEKTKK